MSEHDGNPLKAANRRSLFELIGDLPGLLVDLVRAEIEQFKAELSEKGQRIGLGVALMAVAAGFAFFGLAVLVACAVLAFALIVPAWLAALIVAGILFLLAILLIFIGRGRIQAGLAKSEFDVDLRRDMDVFKGEGSYDRHA
ncbi:putative superfamily III holin-X [Microterricola gilva]|uniref:Putative superfamily III holin-X n=1 Tax=Microterricola gilva TaxID=393267 RepID=A0A4Q8AQH5_9MICO|nr:phage holin family protein [Microterricola gilva]RZU66907.1 putative superfamily III holin-X [Microterricola gilva]